VNGAVYLRVFLIHKFSIILVKNQQNGGKLQLKLLDFITGNFLRYSLNVQNNNNSFSAILFRAAPLLFDYKLFISVN
jgi:hypothetical protein